MSSAESAKNDDKFLKVTNQSEFFPVVKDELQKRTTIYGNQDDSIKKIEDGNDRSCEILLKEAKPQTLLIYKTEPVKEQEVQLSNSLEIKTLLLIDNKTTENLQKTLERAVQIAKEKKAENIHLTCSEREKSTFNFLVNNDFRVCETYDGKYIDGVKEYLMSKPIEELKNENEDKPQEKVVESRKRHFNDDCKSDSHKRQKHDSKNERHGREKNPNFDSCTLMKKYIGYIRDGRKTVEARLNTPMFQKWKEGMIIRFHCRSPFDVHVKITKIKQYNSFKSMLEAEGVRNCIPDVHTVSDGVREYMRIPKYKDREHLGVLAFRIQKVEGRR